MQTFPQLTDRENVVLEHIAKGYQDAEIAIRLSISIHTVRNHVKSIYKSLDVKSCSQATFLYWSTIERVSVDAKQDS